MAEHIVADRPAPQVMLQSELPLQAIVQLPEQLTVQDVPRLHATIPLSIRTVQVEVELQPTIDIAPTSKSQSEVPLHANVLLSPPSPVQFDSPLQPN